MYTYFIQKKKIIIIIINYLFSSKKSKRFNNSKNEYSSNPSTNRELNLITPNQPVLIEGVCVEKLEVILFCLTILGFFWARFLGRKTDQKNQIPIYPR
jgi:hypothetical protein